MAIYNWFSSYFYYLIHPFRTHDELLKFDHNYESFPRQMGIYESLGTSWIFIVINGIIRIMLLNLVIFSVLSLDIGGENIISIVSGEDKYLSFYFVILSTILDVIFYPLITLFFIQFWEFILRIFANFLGIHDNVDDRVRNIMSVSLSSHILSIIPVFGSMAQTFASFVLMFAGIKKQLNASTSLTICILMVPFLILLFFTSIILLAFIFKSFT